MSGAFPVRPADLTANWLSDALGRDVSAFALTRIGAERGNLGHIIRLDFDDGSEPLVAKFSSDQAENLATARRSGLYEREVRFYQRLAPHLDVRVPACHGAFYDDGTGHCLLLLEHVPTDEDLDTVAGIGPERTAQVLTELGLLHAGGRDFLDETWLQGMLFEGRLDNLSIMIEQGWPLLTELCDDFVDPQIGTDLGARFHALMHQMAALDQTVVHGDLKPDNIHAIGDRIAILDWQAVGFGPVAWDVAYAMINCLTIEDRRAHESRLLADYPHDLTGYEQALLFGLVVATALTLLGDQESPRRRELIRTTARRSLAALEDHGVL